MTRTGYKLYLPGCCWLMLLFAPAPFSAQGGVVEVNFPLLLDHPLATVLGLLDPNYIIRKYNTDIPPFQRPLGGIKALQGGSPWVVTKGIGISYDFRAAHRQQGWSYVIGGIYFYDCFEWEYGSIGIGARYRTPSTSKKWCFDTDLLVTLSLTGHAWWPLHVQLTSWRTKLHFLLPYIAIGVNRYDKQYKGIGLKITFTHLAAIIACQWLLPPFASKVKKSNRFFI